MRVPGSSEQVEVPGHLAVRRVAAPCVHLYEVWTLNEDKSIGRRLGDGVVVPGILELGPGEQMAAQQAADSREHQIAVKILHGAFPETQIATKNSCAKLQLWTPDPSIQRAMVIEGRVPKTSWVHGPSSAGAFAGKKSRKGKKR